MSSVQEFVGDGASTHQLVHRPTPSPLATHPHQRCVSLEHSTKPHTGSWAYVCKTRLLLLQCLAHAMFCQGRVWIPYDVGQSLCLSCMEVAPIPTCGPPVRRWYAGHSGLVTRLVLHQSKAALADRALGRVTSPACFRLVWTLLFYGDLSRGTSKF